MRALTLASLCFALGCVDLRAGIECRSDGDCLGYQCESGRCVAHRGALAALVVAPSVGTIVAGSPLSYTISAVDSAGGVISDYAGTVVITLSDRQAKAPPAYTFLPADSGTHLFADALNLKTAGAATISATDSANSAVSGSAIVQVQTGRAAVLAVSNVPDSIKAGDTLTFMVTAQDAYANVVSDYAGTVTCTTGDPKASLPTSYTFTGSERGTHSIGGLKFGTVAAQTFTVQDVAAGISGSGVTRVAPGPAVRYVAHGFPTQSQAGHEFTFGFSGADAYDNRADDYAGTASVAYSDSQALGPSTVQFSGGGTETIHVTLQSFGTQSLRVYDKANPQVQSGNLYVQITPGDPARLEVASLPSQVTAGNGASFTVLAKDRYGNLTPGYSGTLTVTAPDDPRAVLPGSLYMGGDTYSGIQITLTKAGTQRVVVTDLGGLTGTGQTSVSPIPIVAQLGFVVQPSKVPAGEVIKPPIQVGLEDRYGNVIPSATSDRLYLNADLGIFANPIGGIATFDAAIINNAVTGKRLQVSGAAGTALSAPFDVTAAWTIGNLSPAYRVAVSGNGALFADDSYYHHRSLDHGATWSVLTANNPYLYQVFVSPATPFVWARCQVCNSSPCGDGTCASSDNGNTWTITRLPAGSSFAMAAQSIDPTPRLYLILTNAAGDQTLFISTDLGTSWNPTSATNLAGVIPVAGISGGPGNTVYGYKTGSPSLLKSIGGGAWSLVTSSPSLASIYGLAVDPRGNVYVRDAKDVYVSHDGGLTLSLFAASAAAVPSFDPTDANIMYIGGCPVMKTRDGGATWFHANSGLPTSSCSTAGNIAVDPTNHDHIYAAAGAIYQSLTGGE